MKKKQSIVSKAREIKQHENERLSTVINSEETFQSIRQESTTFNRAFSMLWTILKPDWGVQDGKYYII